MWFMQCFDKVTKFQSVRDWAKLEILSIEKTDIIITLIKSRYKTIHQIMYKTKDRKWKKRMKTQLLYTWIEQNQD